jgi:hypothetical protein
VARYVAAARKAAFDMMAHDPIGGDGTYDFAVGPDNDVVLIEVNPLGNFGLYAMDAGFVSNAVLAACRARRHRQPQMSEPALR